MDKNTGSCKMPDFPLLKAASKLMACCGYTCIGGREEDQDCLAYDVIQGRSVFTVCDGMGGQAGGCVASKMTVKVMMESMRRQPPVIPVQEAMVTAVKDANYAVYKESKEKPPLRGMGTTLTLLVIDSEAAYVTHVGDSRIYQLQKGKKIFRTFDNSMVFEQVAKRKLTEEQARVHPRSNVLSKAMGVLPEIDITVKQLEYRRGDRFILCCDGVWNTMPEANIIKEFTKYTDTEKTIINIRSLVESIGKQNGGKHDNHTMIAVDMKTDSRYRKSVWSSVSDFVQTKILNKKV